MAVLVEAISVILKEDRILETLGWDNFCDLVPNKTMCADSEVVRIGFMHPDDVRSFIEELEIFGLIYLCGEESQDLCVVDQQRGPLAQAEWLEFGHLQIGKGNKIGAARLYGSEIPEVVTPEGWVFEGSLSERFLFVPNNAADTVQIEQVEDGPDIVRSPLIDGKMFLGRTRKK